MSVPDNALSKWVIEKRMLEIITAVLAPLVCRVLKINPRQIQPIVTAPHIFVKRSIYLIFMEAEKNGVYRVLTFKNKGNIIAIRKHMNKCSYMSFI